MNSPLISICIAAYKAEKYLEATLRTVFSQNFNDWELIVTEDGSSDRTEEFVKEFAQKVPQRVIYNRHEHNRGLPATRNTGIAAATGEWIAFLDADDLWKPDHLSALLSTSQIEDCDMIYAGSVQYDDATWTKLSTRAPSDQDLIDLPVAIYTGRLSIMSSSVMVKRESIKKFGPFSPEFPICNNTEYWLRILSKGGRILYSGTNTCIYRQHSGGLSSKTTASLSESARICERYRNWDAIPHLIARTRTASLYRWVGRMLLDDSPSEALKPLCHSLRIQPLNPKTLGLWARAFFHQSSKHRHAA